MKKVKIFVVLNCFILSSFAQVPGTIYFTDGKIEHFNNVEFVSVIHTPSGRSGKNFIMVNYNNSERELYLKDILSLEVKSFGGINGVFVKDAIVEFRTKTGVVFTDNYLQLNSFSINKLDELSGSLIKENIYFGKHGSGLIIKKIVFD
jgi:hypothetical protein